jgi:two-component sensor histidine kinase
MAEGTRSNQLALAESLANLRAKNTENKEFQASMREFHIQVQNTLNQHDAISPPLTLNYLA